MDETASWSNNRKSDISERELQRLRRLHKIRDSVAHAILVEIRAVYGILAF